MNPINTTASCLQMFAELNPGKGTQAGPSGFRDEGQTGSFGRQAGWTEC